MYDGQPKDLESNPGSGFVSGVFSRYELCSRTAKVRYVYMGGGLCGRLIPGMPLLLILPGRSSSESLS